MKRTTAFFIAIILFLGALPSCAPSAKKTCRDIVLAMTDAEKNLPAGKYYSLSASEGESEYLSDSLISSLFGNSYYQKISEKWIDGALFLSLTPHPCEFAVIYCSDRDNAEDTAKLFLSRIDAIKIAKSSPEYGKIIENAKVEIRGNYALLIISSDPDKALKAFTKNK